MAHHVHVVRLRRRPGVPPALIAVFVFGLGLAWILELWLVVLGSAASALALIRRRHWYRRAVLPAVVAGTAVAARTDDDPSDGIEEWAAVWLAVAAEGRPGWLHSAVQLLAGSDGDPWTLRVAVTRLEAAEDMLRDRRVQGVRSRRDRNPPGWGAGIWLGLAIAFLGVAHWQNTWWLIPTAGALSAAAFGLGELERSRVAPRLIAMEALAVPFRWDENETTAPHLALLARGDRVILRRARRLVRDAQWNIPHRQAALRKLSAAEALSSDLAWNGLGTVNNGFPWWKPL